MSGFPQDIPIAPDLALEEVRPHPLLRVWPPPEANDGGVPGEYDVTLRGSEADYHRFHRALVQAGFYVDDSAVYEVYVRAPGLDPAEPHGCQGV